MPGSLSAADTNGFPLLKPLDALVRDVLVKVQQRGREPELPTGLGGLDEAIWGLERGSVHVIAARPNEGKTALSLQIATHLADRHKRVAFLSLEMTTHQLVERYLVQLTQTDAWQLRKGLDIAAFVEKVNTLLPMMANMNLRIIDNCGYTKEELRFLVNKLTQHDGLPDVLVIDHLQNAHGEPGMQRFDSIAEYVQTLKELAMRHHLAVLLCSQINREGSKKKRPTMSDLKGSGSIEEKADCLMLLWWEDLGTEEQPMGKKFWILVEKNRNGPKGAQVPIQFDSNKLTFHSLSEDFVRWSDGKAVTEAVTIP